ncbi:MAG TPA: UDP-glucose 6-dehydrogenase, partial [Acidimicrobiia bacterium]|nr:UDP-glucose 6-dehydrogenase [Acidimicrobiia bacterium]
MDIAIIGAGYVGLVTGAGLAELGHRIRIGETSSDRVVMLEAGDVPIYEERLPELLSKARDRGAISFHTSNVEAVTGARLIFLCLPTPEGADGRADLSFINEVVDELATEVGEESVFVVKSTVPPG